MDRGFVKKTVASIVSETSKIIIGKEQQLELIAAAVICEGHVLLEDLPGTGKTTLIRTLSLALGCDRRRIQFTPDLLPSDVIGTTVFNQKTSEFNTVLGPVNTNLLLADEINRAIPRTQAALLEAMEEHQVTIDGTTYRLPDPFFVLATQNPVEKDSTFPLPAAQLDRFFMKLSLGYMTRDQEIGILRRQETIRIIEELGQVVSTDEILQMRRAFSQVTVSDEIAAYIMQIIEYTRNSSLLVNGVSTRGSLALYKASQIHAALNGRDFVIPEDVKKEAMAVLPHRIMLSGRSHLGNMGFVRNMLEDIEVPLEQS